MKQLFFYTLISLLPAFAYAQYTTGNKLCETQCYSVVRRFITRPKRAYPAEYIRKRQELNAFFSRKVGLEQANYSREKTF